MEKCRLALLVSLPFLLPSSLPAQEANALRWGADTDGGFPYVFADPDNPKETIGFEMDLAKALEVELGRKIVFVQRDYAGLIPDLDRGDIDIAMNGLEITPENLNQAGFSKPYYLYQLQLVTRATEARFKSLDEAKAKGLIIGTLNNTAAERLLKDQEIKFKSYADQQAPYQDLLDGVVDGVLMDLPIAIYYAAPDRTLKYSQYKPGLKLMGPAFAEGFYGIAVRKTDTALRAELNAAITRLQDSGKLKEILQRWHLWTPDQYRLYEVNIEAGGDAMTFARYFPLLLEGAGVTVLITFAGFFLAMLLGMTIALLRMYGAAPVRWFALGYIEFFRGIPVLLLLYFLYYGLPAVFGPAAKLDALYAAILGFGLNYAAYEAEIYRAGIASIPRGQWEAAASLGMGPALTFRRIIFPQALRVVLPPSTNDLVALFKDTSVVSIIAVVELSKEYQILTKSG
ncbi:MAG: ABC transporter substrate-binding protein/permease, partial [Gemmataceae bacterium]